jgi:hypothetical protein
MDAFISGKEFRLYGVDSEGHPGVLGEICDIMGCTEICNQFIEVQVFNISHVAIGNTDRSHGRLDEMIYDYTVLWKKPS